MRGVYILMQCLKAYLGQSMMLQLSLKGPSLIWLVLRAVREVLIVLIGGSDRDGVANGILVAWEKNTCHPRHDENASLYACGVERRTAKYSGEA